MTKLEKLEAALLKAAQEIADEHNISDENPGPDFARGKYTGLARALQMVRDLMPQKRLTPWMVEPPEVERARQREKDNLPYHPDE